MQGKEHSRKSLSSSIARATDLTNITTWSYGSEDQWRIVNDKSSHLVEVEGVQQVVELAVFLGLLELKVILLEAVERQLCLVVNEYLKRLEEGAYQHACQQN